MARRSRTASSTAKALAVVIVVMLIVVTIVLVYFAFERVRSTPNPSRPDPVPSFTFGPQESPSPSPSSSAADPTPAAASGALRSEERFLSVGSGSIWRATAGECGTTTPIVERSNDGGESWVDVTPRYLGIGQVISLDAFADTEAEIVALVGGECETQALRTFTQGEFWESYPDVLKATRFLEPASPPTAVTPEGRIDAPCAEPHGMRASGDIVALVCNDVALRLVGGAWAALPAVDVRTLTIDGESVVTAGLGAACDGITITRWSGDVLAESAQLGCITDAVIDAPMAIAATGTGVVLWSGDAVLTVN